MEINQEFAKNVKLMSVINEPIKTLQQSDHKSQLRDVYAREAREMCHMKSETKICFMIRNLKFY